MRSVLPWRSWLQSFSMGFDAKRRALLEVSDPLAARLLEIRLQQWDHIDELVAGYLGVSQVFAPSLAAHPIFVQRLTYWLGVYFWLTACRLLCKSMIT
ncbi:MAG: hypothetical protein U5L02_16780 [Rheinheimera sp.]|nr:hypothetical protein [Rheinheimera sp.]